MTTLKPVMRKVILTPRIIHGVFDIFQQDGTKTLMNDHPATELRAPVLQLRDPIDRLITDRGRRVNIAAAIALLTACLVKVPDDWTRQFMGAEDYGPDDEDLWPYDDGHFVRHEGLYIGDALRETAAVLEDRPHSVVGPDLLQTYSNELDLYFMVRERALHLYVNAGPMDVVRDFPYDLFVAAGLHEYMARRTGHVLGDLVLTTPSLYVYELDKPQMDKTSKRRWPFKVWEMPDLELEDLEAYQELVTVRLLSSTFHDTLAAASWQSSARRYLASWAYVLRAFTLRTSKPSECLKAHDALKDSTLKFVLRQWLATTGLVVPRGVDPAEEEMEAI